MLRRQTVHIVMAAAACAVMLLPPRVCAGLLQVLQPRSVAQVGNRPNPNYGVRDAAWIPSKTGSHAITVSQIGNVIVWDTAQPPIVVDTEGIHYCELQPAADGRGVVHRTAVTDCILPENQDVAGKQYVKPQSLHVSPDGNFALMVGTELGHVETQLFDLRTRAPHWLNRRPRLWIGASPSRLIVSPGNDCAANACGLTLIDPATLRIDQKTLGEDVAALKEEALGSRFGDGGMMTASADSERFASVAGPRGARRLGVWKSADLTALGDFDLGVAEPVEIGFDAAGGKVFARTATGRLLIFDLSGKAAQSIDVGPAALGAQVVLTDIDARVLLESADIGPRLVDFHGVRRAAPNAAFVTAFPHHGAVFIDNDDQAMFIDFASARTTSLPGQIPIRALAADPDSMDDSPPTAVAQYRWMLSLSSDGKWLLAGDHVMGPIGGPGPATDRPLKGIDLLQDEIVLFPSPDGMRFAVSLGDKGVWVFDLTSARFFPVYQPSAGGPEGSASPDILGWVSNDTIALNADNAGYLAVDIHSGGVDPRAGQPAIVAAGSARATDRPPCLSERPKPWAGPTLVPAGCYTWEWHADGTVMFKSAVDWQDLFTLYLHPDGTWFARGANERYDTNESADASDIRWWMPDRPWRSLPAQTFMRQLYQPGLLAKLLDCSVRGTGACDRAFPPLTDIGSLNQSLPEVASMTFAPGARPALVNVDVAVKEGADPSAATGKTRSGVYDLRLFRNNKLVDQWPGPPPSGLDDTSISSWRANNQLAPGPSDPSRPARESPDKDGLIHHVFTVHLPSGPQGTEHFSAYALNEDRVKSETAVRDYDRPATAPLHARSRAYVLNIGANGYANPAWALRFAAPDAALMADTLARGVQDYDVRTMTLLNPASGGGRIFNQATKGLIGDALKLLGRTDGAVGQPSLHDQAAARDSLARAGVRNAAAFETATPDDIVIITFAGHGWTSDRGDFYLVPSDGNVVSKTDSTPQALTFISAGALTDWLRPVDAGETAIVIDACHSAASVEAAGFKPAPLGDAGLGQLAFDKGIRILAASQADAVAMEDPNLGHGLLTYALAGEALGGVKAGDPASDALKSALFRNRPIRVTNWLTYGAQRIPSLSHALAADRATPPSGSGDISFDPPRASNGAPPEVQEPQLFDFTGSPSVVTLKPAPQGVERRP